MSTTRSARSRPSAPPGWQPYPLAGTGGEGQVTLLVRRGIASPELRNRRDVWVALPPGAADGARYPVVYMQDGQNLFDPAISANGDWGLAGTLAALASDGCPAIVAGIANTGARRGFEYSPFRDPVHAGGGGDRYLSFVVGTLKPHIDAVFPTEPDRRHTVVAGASLGGLISLYAFFRHPSVFGAAAALSPSIWFGGRAVLRFIAERPAPAAGLLYFDAGTEEDADLVADVGRLRDLLEAQGRREGDGYRSVVDPGAGHDEGAWGRRFRAALPYLLGRCARATTAG